MSNVNTPLNFRFNWISSENKWRWIVAKVSEATWDNINKNLDNAEFANYKPVVDNFFIAHIDSEEFINVFDYVKAVNSGKAATSLAIVSIYPNKQGGFTWELQNINEKLEGVYISKAAFKNAGKRISFVKFNVDNNGMNWIINYFKKLIDSPHK